MIKKIGSQYLNTPWLQKSPASRYLLITFLAFVLSIQMCLGQSLTPFANLVFLGHACNTSGEVVFILLV